MGDVSNATWWTPPAGTTWQIDLSTIIQADALPNVTAVDGDLYANNATWSAIKQAGYHTVCYFSAGSYEDWRADAGEFNKSDIGAPLQGWQGEWWLNTRSAGVRKIMEQRLDTAKSYGCDAVDPDNVDAYNNGGGGFNLTEDDAVDYIRFLAGAAHDRGMASGLKNALDIVPDVLDVVDFQVNEQCLQYSECSNLTAFIHANKPVFEIEYRDGKPSDDTLDQICTAPSRDGFSTLVKHMNLTLWGYACNVDGKAPLYTSLTANQTEDSSSADSSSAATHETDASSSVAATSSASSSSSPAASSSTSSPSPSSTGNSNGSNGAAMVPLVSLISAALLTACLYL